MNSASVAGDATKNSSTLFGHPTGLFTLFFAEMWERFSYYGMRALLVFYMTKGFLGYGEGVAKTVYGAYTALVYMTPFIGGMLADRLLGQRIAVIIGGLLMAAGHLLMGVENTNAFYFAMAFLIIGNGLFKPNISTIVGTLYKPGSKLRDGGFTIFYMGVNLGAAMSPLLCGFIGETYGWHYGFGLATIGMMIGLAVFVMPNRVTQLLIGCGAAAALFALLYFRPDNIWAILLNLVTTCFLAVAGFLSIKAVGMGGLPATSGAAPANRPIMMPLIAVLAGIAIVIPVMALFVSGFSIVRGGESYRVIDKETIERFVSGEGGEKIVAPDDASGQASDQKAPDSKTVSQRLRAVVGIFLSEIARPAGMLLTIIGVISFGYLIMRTFSLDTIARHRMVVALTLTFFSMLFWSFFEQAGSSLNLFADRSIDRVSEQSRITADQIGNVIKIQPTQEQVGYHNGEKIFTLGDLDQLRKANLDERRTDPKHAPAPSFEIEWTVHDDNVGMGIADRRHEFPASLFQAVNAIFILILGLVFTSLWSFLANRGNEPSTPVKFAFGLIQLGMGFGAFWIGVQMHDDRAMVSAIWLIAGYGLHTTGELCLSPVGLSMITRLSPKVLVSTMMGGWFLATAFSQYLAGIISQFTGVDESAGVSEAATKLEVLQADGGVFANVAITAIASGVFCLFLAPLLTRWMHAEVPDESSEAAAGGH